MSEDDHVSRAFEKSLNAQGYGFQYSALEFIRTSCPSWRVEAVEMPVVVGGAETRIDFVLSSISRQIVVAECKRVDPAKGRWCFIRGENASLYPLVEVFSTKAGHRDPQSTAHFATVGTPYHVALEVRDPDARGTGLGSHKSSIDQAVEQVLRAASGLLNALHSVPLLVPEGRNTPVFPVIFTTAKLYACDEPLSRADLTTGDMSGLKLRPVEWVWLDYNTSRSLHHGLPGRWNDVTDLDTYTRRVFARVSAIVSAQHIRAFLEGLEQNPPVVHV